MVLPTPPAQKPKQPKKPLVYRWLAAPFTEPYARYLYANGLHAVRLGTAVIVALLINTLTHLPHGEWTLITVFIILGLLQYQGSIYTKAKERVLGTLLGIVVGLLLLWIGNGLTHYLWVYYLLIGMISGVIGYYAIKQLGYIGLLTGITMCMIISSSGGDNSVGHDGVYRALNVIIGTLVAVAATLILPLKSTLMWRFLLANNLDACADIYSGIGTLLEKTNASNSFADSFVLTPINNGDTNEVNKHGNKHDTKKSVKETTTDGLNDASSHKYIAYQKSDGNNLPPELVAHLKKINQRLLTVRTHIAATASESGIDKQVLESIQRTHRNIIGMIDLLLTSAPKIADSAIDEDNRELLLHYQQELTQAMRHMAAVLRSPSDEMFRPITRIQVSQYPSVQLLDFDWQGYFWLTQTLQTQLQTMSDLLKQTKPQWYAASGLRYQRYEKRVEQRWVQALEEEEKQQN